MGKFNPIRTVDGIEVYCPAKYLYKLEDVSASDAGRTEDTMMQKNRIGQVVGMELSWAGLTIKDAAKVLQQFDPEYIMVEYLDAKQGGYLTAEFYVGNRSALLWNAFKGIWESISFNLIKRSGV